MLLAPVGQACAGQAGSSVKNVWPVPMQDVVEFFASQIQKKQKSF